MSSARLDFCASKVTDRLGQRIKKIGSVDRQIYSEVFLKLDIFYDREFAIASKVCMLYTYDLINLHSAQVFLALSKYK